MKIGFDAKRLYNNFTGLGNYSRTLVGNLIEMFSANEFFLYTPKSKIEPLDGATTRLPSCCRAIWRNWGVKRDLKRDGIELFHGLSHELPFGIQKSGIRSVVTIHDLCYKTFPEMFPLSERIIYNIKYKHSCRNADRIIAISESTKADIIKYMEVSPEKIEVIYQAIDPLFYTPQSDPRKVLEEYPIPKRFILSVGVINSRKNLMGIIKAYQLLPEECRLPLVIIGNGTKYRQKVLDYAAKNDLMQYIIMLDSVREMKRVQAFYQLAECLVYPSFYEGFGLPVTEALLSGTPVITSSTSSLPEAGGDAALYVNPENPQEIADAIQRVLSDRSLVEDMKKRGIEYAIKTFDPEKLTQQVGNLYKSLLP